MSHISLPAKYQGETKNVPFDFTSDLAVGETITSQVVTASVYSGTDAGPSALIQGSASVSGAVVTQAITGGVVGVMYTLLCTITTSAVQTLQKSASLTVLPTAT